MPEQILVDLLIIGGGVNGTGIACDAAGRGLNVHLCEQNDLASGTSSKSTKLIHGGLRYLEYYEFRLVREALAEREILWRKAPHIIWPLSFVLPHHPGMRPAWLLRAGLLLYDHLGQRQKLPKSQAVHLQHSPYGDALQPQYRKGFVYPDCWVDDARLVILNAQAAQAHGARIDNYCTVQSLHREADAWHARVFDKKTQQTRQIRARAVVNATGPWIAQFYQQATALPCQHSIQMVKGSHIVVPKLYPGEQAYILQQNDQRIVFAIPYQQHWTLIGTTEMVYQGDPAYAQVSDAEINYLCKIINQYFKQSIQPNDVIWQYAGVRPLFDGQGQVTAQSRDYLLELDTQAQQLPLLSVFGGKITTYRTLAQNAVDKLKPFFPQLRPHWTAHAPLPGGDLPQGNFDLFLKQLQTDYAFLPASLLYRYARQYGSAAYTLLKTVQKPADLGQNFGADCYQIEVAYLQNHEWAHHAQDILWRRTKLGLYMSADAQQNLASHCQTL